MTLLRMGADSPLADDGRELWDWTGLWVPGQPFPQPRPRIVRMGPICPHCHARPVARAVSNAGKAGAKCNLWRTAVRSMFTLMGVRRQTIPLEVEVLFKLRPPQSLLRQDGSLRAGKSSRPYPTGARDGDVDNLFKGTVDALEGVLFENDSTIVDGRSRKVWAVDNSPTGALIRWRPQ